MLGKAMKSFLSIRPHVLLAAGMMSAGVASGSELPNRTQYEGYFTDVVATSGDCSHLFAQDDYEVTHFRMGPTRRSSVMNLTSKAGEPDNSFFHRMSFYGLLGGSNDLFYEKQVTKGSLSYDIQAAGFIGEAVVYLEFAVSGKDSAGSEVCQGTATFSAFN